MKYMKFLLVSAIIATLYTEALAEEIAVTAARGGHVRVPSIYLGGGTPLLLPAELIGGLLTAMRAFFEVADDAEVTLEANPTIDHGWQTTSNHPSSVVSTLRNCDR